MLRLTAVCLGVALLSCNEREAPSGGGTATTSQALLTPPPMPALQETTAFKPGTTLFPPTVKSAYLVTLRDPDAPGVVYAFGFDVVAGKNYFLIKTTPSEQRAISDQVQVDISRWKEANAEGDKSNGTADGSGTTFHKVGGGPPHGPKAWTIAYNHAVVDHEAQAIK
jgi:hypothetical protein